MTVSTSINSVVYRGNGATTDFAVPFKVLDEDHLVVRRRVFATGAYAQTYVGTEYSYVGIGASAGTLTLDGTALDDDYELVIERIVPYTQDLDIVNAGGFYPDTVEEQLDLTTMAIQQIADLANRGIIAEVGEDGLVLPSATARALKYLAFDALGGVVMAEGTTTPDLALVAANTLFLQSSGSYSGYLYSANPVWIGTGTGAPSDNAVVVAGNNYSDATGLVDSIHTFCTVGTASVTAAGEGGNDYDTRRIYTGNGVWAHHNHFQIGTTFEGNVIFNEVLGLAGTVTFRGNAQIGTFCLIDFAEAAPTDTATVGHNVMLRYPNSHYASDMTGITSDTVNYVLEVRKYLLDPATAYAASIMSEGAATFKAISAADTEVGPYNADGTLNASLERFNIRSAAGQNGYVKFSNTGNAWLVGQVADSIDFRIRTTSGAAGGIDIANAGHVTPSADNSADLGTAALSWRGVYADTGFYIGGTKVLGAQQTGAPAAANDAATTQTLTNFIRTALLAHGAIAA